MACLITQPAVPCERPLALSPMSPAQRARRQEGPYSSWAPRARSSPAESETLAAFPGPATGARGGAPHPPPPGCFSTLSPVTAAWGRGGGASGPMSEARPSQLLGTHLEHVGSHKRQAPGSSPSTPLGFAQVASRPSEGWSSVRPILRKHPDSAQPPPHGPAIRGQPCRDRDQESR